MSLRVLTQLCLTTTCKVWINTFGFPNWEHFDLEVEWQWLWISSFGGFGLERDTDPEQQHHNSPSVQNWEGWWGVKQLPPIALCMGYSLIGEYLCCDFLVFAFIKMSPNSIKKNTIFHEAVVKDRTF